LPTFIKILEVINEIEERGRGRRENEEEVMVSSTDGGGIHG